tara:strand:+ start:684 stop:992 length:309 start_codon:yes stop_codon:yes gene_type:complete
MSNVDNNNNETGRIAGKGECWSEDDGISDNSKETVSVPKETASVPKETDNLKQINLIDVDITDENVALNVIIGYLGVAQKRGTFAINESAKIYECVKKFTSN